MDAQTSACWKKRYYPSKRIAVAHGIISEYKTGISLYWYRCPYCGGVHLSHKYYPQSGHPVGDVSYKRLMRARRITRTWDEAYFSGRTQ